MATVTDHGSDLERWIDRWRAASAAARVVGQRDDTAWGAGRVSIGPPASLDELAAVESASGLAMPDTLRQLFLLARSVDVSWHLADDIDPPKPFHQIFSGGTSWSVDRVVTVIEDYRGWVASVFPDPNDPYDMVWHDTYPWLDVPNGDIVAIDADGRVVYLSHDDGEGHGYVLGRDVFDFLEHWTRLGCPGPEDWQWLPFARVGGDGLDPDGEAGRSWRAWFGIP